MLSYTFYRISIGTYCGRNHNNHMLDHLGISSNYLVLKLLLCDAVMLMGQDQVIFSIMLIVPNYSFSTTSNT